ncbi:hypothetical protein AN218_11545, partial [Streptomyces nanshensis]
MLDEEAAEEADHVRRTAGAAGTGTGTGAVRQVRHWSAARSAGRASSAGDPAPVWRPGGVYLVSGGAGGL